MEDKHIKERRKLLSPSRLSENPYSYGRREYWDSESKYWMTDKRKQWLNKEANYDPHRR